MPVTDDGTYEPAVWHDDTLYGLRFELGDPEAGDWRAELVLDIDHIVEWLCADDGRVRFRVAPATLAFLDVSDLRLAVDWGDSDHQVMLHPITIDRIVRERVALQKICLDRPYWRWRIVLAWPRGGEIAFGASGFSLDLRAEPVVSDEQVLGRRAGPEAGPGR